MDLGAERLGGRQGGGGRPRLGLGRGGRPRARRRDRTRRGGEGQRRAAHVDAQRPALAGRPPRGSARLHGAGPPTAALDGPGQARGRGQVHHEEGHLHRRAVRPGQRAHEHRHPARGTRRLLLEGRRGHEGPHRQDRATRVRRRRPGRLPALRRDGRDRRQDPAGARGRPPSAAPVAGLVPHQWRADDPHQPGRHHGDLAQPGHICHEQANRLGVRTSLAESAGYLHVWQVTAHLLGVLDEYIPASWDEANAQSRQVLDPILASTPEGVELTDVLLDIVAELDAGLTRPLINGFTRYTLGNRTGDLIGLDKEPFWQPLISAAWPLLVAFREGLIPLPLIPQAAWTVEEALRKFVLFYLSEGRGPSIEIPDANRPS
ncbi:oxygenase MpaB family protein [Streptomyces violaceorubidus]|uniref:oxygenase MpaB family protein n=1 Tax=Streptomyces violaceorubidus TaxID=284042 RepID=UPI0031596128